jgi:hypothetical protein
MLAHFEFISVGFYRSRLNKNYPIKSNSVFLNFPARNLIEGGAVSVRFKFYRASENGALRFTGSFLIDNFKLGTCC